MIAINEKPKVLGKFIYITLPPEKDTKMIVDANTKEALLKEVLRKHSKLQIWAVGEVANPLLKEDMWVLVTPDALVRANRIKFDYNGEEVSKALVLDYDIVHIWP